MTQIRLGLSAPTSDGAGRRPSGSLEWRPTKRRAVGDDVVLPAPFTVGLADPAPVIEVDPTGLDWAWRVVERVQGGSESARYLTVPDSGAVLDYADLTAVDPATLEPTAEPEAAWWAALEAGGGGGGGTVADATTTTKGKVQLAGDLAGTAAAPTVPALAGKAATTDPRFTDARTPVDGSVTDVKVATGAAISADKLADGTGSKVLTAAERTKLAGVATGATANATDAQLRDRATHTGTQSADTLTDGTTNKAFLATERTKLAGVATGATANATDAQLRDRSTHTGAQAAGTITGLATVATTGAYADLSGKPTIPAAYTDEQVRDVIGTALVAGANVTITPNDAADTITIAATGGGGGGTPVTAGTVAGQIPVWDGDSYEPQAPTAATATDVPFTPAGAVAATNVQAAIVELDTEKSATGHTHAAQGISVQDENGSAITGVTRLDFQGAGVTATAGTGEVVVTIPGGGGGGGTTATPLRSGAWYDGSTVYAASTFAAFAVNRLYAAGFVVTEAVTVDQLSIATNAANAGVTVKLLVYGSDADGEPAAKLAESGDLDIAAISTPVYTFPSGLSVSPGVLWLCAVFSGTTTGIRQRAVTTSRPLGYSALTDGNNNIDQLYGTTTYGTQPTTFPTIGAHNLAVPAVRIHIASKP